MRRFRMFYSFEKEETWINGMALKGYRFTGRSAFWGIYHFEKAEPHSLNIRIDYRLIHKDDDFLNYIQIFSDSGWQHISGGNTGCNYFIPVREDAAEDIFSDAASEAGRYRRLCKNSIISFLAFLPLMLFAFHDSLKYFQEMIRNPVLFFDGSYLYLTFLFLLNITVLGIWLYTAIRAYQEEKKIRNKEL